MSKMALIGQIKLFKKANANDFEHDKGFIFSKYI